MTFFDVQHSQVRNSAASRNARPGAVTVETAIILPILIYIFLGAIDVGQYIDLSQTVTNASRDGARLAARDSTTTVSEVRQAVTDYLQDRFPAQMSESIGEEVLIEILNDNGTIIVGNDLSTLSSGEQFSVKVTFDYSTVRWIKAVGYVLRDEFTVTTVGRRE